mmetsp:Transcript_34403/g.75266  ORF Transcript_34403/g.75266 Transcript_34403/m.75266 type:complete len:250 (+) Transcript_34403:119-868(+)
MTLTPVSKLCVSAWPPGQQKTSASRVGMVVTRCGASRGQVLLGLLPLLRNLLKHSVHLGKHLLPVLLRNHVRAAKPVQHLVGMQQTTGKQVPCSQIAISSQGSSIPQHLGFVRSPHEVSVTPWSVLVGLCGGVPKGKELLPPLLCRHRRRSIKSLSMNGGRRGPRVPLLAGLRPFARLACVACCLSCHAPHGCIHVVVPEIPCRQRHSERISLKRVSCRRCIRLIHRDSIVHCVEKSPSPGRNPLVRKD